MGNAIENLFTANEKSLTFVLNRFGPERSKQKSWRTLHRIPPDHEYTKITLTWNFVSSKG
jgi:hypothetical protein